MLDSLTPIVRDVIEGKASYEDLNDDQKNEMFYFFYPDKKAEAEGAYSEFRTSIKEYKQILRLYSYAIGGSFILPLNLWGLVVAANLRNHDNPLINRKVYIPTLIMSLSSFFQLVMFVFFMLNVFANYQSGNVGHSTYVYIFGIDFIFSMIAAICAIFSVLKFNLLDKRLTLKKGNVQTKNMLNVKYWTDMAVDAGFRKAKHYRQTKIREKTNAKNN